MTEEKAIKWIAELFNESPDNIQSDTLRDDIPEWDSIGVLTLMAELDEKFDIVVTNEETAAMTKVGDLIRILHQKGKIN